MTHLHCRTDALPEDAEALFGAAERDSFDLSPAWFELLAATALPEAAKPGFELWREDGRLLAVLPALVEPAGLWGRRGRGLTTYYSSLFRPILAADASAASLARLLRAFADGHGLDQLRLDLMDVGHPSFGLCEEALRRAGLKPFRFFAFGNWYLPVAGRTYADYIATLPSRLRNTIARRGRKFQAFGRGRLELVCGGDALEAAIATWTRIYQASWKQPEPYARFMPGLLRLCARRGWLRMGIAYYDGEPIAAQVWIVNHGRAAIYKLAYDEAHASHSAGTLLTDFLLRQVIDADKVEEVDYLVGDDAYKQDWMSHRRERWGIVAYNPVRPAGALGWAREAIGRSVKAYLGGAGRHAKNEGDDVT